jgi:hypothetical protein
MLQIFLKKIVVNAYFNNIGKYYKAEVFSEYLNVFEKITI